MAVHRRQEPHRETSGAGAAPPVDDRPLTDLTAPHNPERDVITRDTALNVLRCIGGLRDNYRVLLCQFLDGLTPQETADRMGRSWVSVRNWQMLGCDAAR